MCTSSASDFACIFSMTWARSTLTVRSEIPSSAAICLLSKPATTPLYTSNSRALKVVTALLQDLLFRICHPRPRVTCHRFLDGLEQPHSVDRFCEEIDGACLHCGHAHRDIAMCRQIDDGHRVTSLHQSLVQVQATGSGHEHVEHDATETVLRRGQEEFRAGAIGADLDSQPHSADCRAQS